MNEFILLNVRYLYLIVVTHISSDPMSIAIARSNVHGCSVAIQYL